MKTKIANLTPPPLPQMAGELLASKNQMTLDHYLETQGRRLLAAMQADPLPMVTEMWRMTQELVATAWHLAEKRHLLEKQENGQPVMRDHVRSEMLQEAYQSMCPAVPTPEADELTPAQAQKVNDWLESLAAKA